MAENENPDIAVVLAKLEQEDVAAAEDAGAALEWIAGDQGQAFITQQRIQNFYWYELPVKWFIDLEGKLRVAEALARALDLLQLPRYAAVCRSQTTHEILTAYEISTAQARTPSAGQPRSPASPARPAGVPMGRGDGHGGGLGVVVDRRVPGGGRGQRRSRPGTAGLEDPPAGTHASAPE